MQTNWLVEFEDGSKEFLTIEQTRPTFDHVSAALSNKAYELGKGKIINFEMVTE